MRRAVLSTTLILPLLFLAACQEEPDFDSRYEKAATEIEARARAMDADIARADGARADRAAAAASEGLQDAPAPSNPPSSSGE